MPQTTKQKQFETKAIHDGSAPDPRTGAVIPPIYQTSTYAQKAPGDHTGCLLYTSPSPRDRTRSRMPSSA